MDRVPQLSSSSPKRAIGEGPLSHLAEWSSDLLKNVGDTTVSTFPGEGATLDLLLGEAYYQEKMRLKKMRPLSPGGIFTLPRYLGDRKLWKEVHGGLLSRSTEADRTELLRKIIGHYGQEILGHFDRRVYRFAVSVVPWGFSWFYNAASVRRFLPWGMERSLENVLQIRGHVDHLKKLSEKGTILLVPTHQSNLDSVLVGYVIYLMGLPPFAYGAGLNLFSNPVLSFFMSRLGAYTVDRQKTNPIYKKVLKNYSTEILRRGIHSIFFPGGGRSRSGAIESDLKLGLLGTGLEAQVANFRAGKEKPNIYVVPMVTSYHYVMEALSLVEAHLESLGGHRFLGADTEDTGPLANSMKFLWKFFSMNSTVTVRVGRPMDIFGNPVDEEGRSLGPNGVTIDPKAWLTSGGELGLEPDRDREYVRQLGKKLVTSYYQENTVLSSHLVAFSFFAALRRKYPELDLYRFLRLSAPQRSLPLERFRETAREFHGVVTRAAQAGRLQLSDELKVPGDEWMTDGIRHLGLLHDADAVKIRGDVITTDDMNLLYYYRNRLAGYGFSILGESGPRRFGPGDYDSKGFLA